MMIKEVIIISLFALSIRVQDVVLAGSRKLWHWDQKLSPTWERLSTPLSKRTNRDQTITELLSNVPSRFIHEPCWTHHISSRVYYIVSYIIYMYIFIYDISYVIYLYHINISNMTCHCIIYHISNIIYDVMTYILYQHITHTIHHLSYEHMSCVILFYCFLPYRNVSVFWILIGQCQVFVHLVKARDCS